jgi:hypothetical protein
MYVCMCVLEKNLRSFGHSYPQAVVSQSINQTAIKQKRERPIGPHGKSKKVRSKANSNLDRDFFLRWSVMPLHPHSFATCVLTRLGKFSLNGRLFTLGNFMGIHMYKYPKI